VEVVFLAEKLVFDEKGRAESLVDSLDSGIVEIDVRIDDVRVVNVKPGKVGRSYFAVFARNDEAKAPTPAAVGLRKYGVEHGLPVLMLVDQIRDADRARSNVCFSCGHESVGRSMNVAAKVDDHRLGGHRFGVTHRNRHVGAVILVGGLFQRRRGVRRTRDYHGGISTSLPN
jgi:hypothetical protein